MPSLLLKKELLYWQEHPPSPFPSLDSQGMLKLKIILIENLFIYSFWNINEKKQECQDKNILIHVSEYNTVKNHIIELKNNYNLYLVLMFFTDMNCVFHSRKWTWQGFLSQSFLRKEYEAVLEV